MLHNLLEAALAVLAGLATIELIRQMWLRAQCDLGRRKSDALRRARDLNGGVAEGAFAELDEIQEERELMKYASWAWRALLLFFILAWLALWSLGYGL